MIWVMLIGKDFGGRLWREILDGDFWGRILGGHNLEDFWDFNAMIGNLRNIANDMCNDFWGNFGGRFWEKILGGGILEDIIWKIFVISVRWLAICGIGQ